jgi:hypothetical protein
MLILIIPLLLALCGDQSTLQCSALHDLALLLLGDRHERVQSPFALVRVVVWVILNKRLQNSKIHQLKYDNNKIGKEEN